MMSFSKKSATKWLLNSALAFTLAVSLAGCSGADEETPELQKTSDASMTEPMTYIPASEDGPAENVPEPRLPELATENSEDGALATLEYFWESAQYMRLTGDADPITLVSADACDFCSAFVEDWQKTYSAGYWAAPEGEVELSVTESWVGHSDEVNIQSADVLFSVSEPEIVLYDRDGERQELDESEGEKSSEWFALLLFDSTAQQWTVEWIGLEELVNWED